jgi:hypothetical protein
VVGSAFPGIGTTPRQEILVVVRVPSSYVDMAKFFASSRSECACYLNRTPPSEPFPKKNDTSTAPESLKPAALSVGLADHAFHCWLNSTTIERSLFWCSVLPSDSVVKQTAGHATCKSNHT